MNLLETNSLTKISAWLLISAFFFQSCSKEDSVSPVGNTTSVSMNNLNVPSNFDWSMARSFQLEVTTSNNKGEALSGAYIEIFDVNPIQVIDGVEVFNANNTTPIYKGKTSVSGKLDARFTLKNSIKELYVQPLSASLSGTYTVSVQNLQVSTLTIGGNTNRVIGTPVVFKKTSTDYKFLGNWDNLGYPLYSVGKDVVSDDFLATVNASLPESIALTESHPEYLDAESNADLVLQEEAEVWLTFIHEGAGQTNTLGYYTYPAGAAPSTVGDIKNPTIAFPNTSFVNYGGNLETGDKVQLKYWNPVTEEFQDLFPANTAIGWFLESNGWSKDTQTVGNGYYTAYSNEAFNPEPLVEKKKHNVLLYDKEHELIVLGFEDLKRNLRPDGTVTSDEDFNDAVFYISANPFSAIDDDLDETDKGEDPEPEEQHVAGTLAFEDLWPSKGDYDFNDLVLNYDFKQTVNNDGELLALECAYTVRAIGASYHNGFAVELPIPASAIASVTGSNLTKSYIETAANGTETGQPNAVIVFFDDAYDILPSVGGSYVNTMADAPYATPNTFTIVIEFVEPVALSEIGLPPYNPFLIINSKTDIDGDVYTYRDAEVHLPNHLPTAKAKTNLLGSFDDDSSIANNRYYLSKDNLPWALNIPASFDYPYEKIPVVQAFTHFAAWARSGGITNPDWYENKSGYRVDSHIYQH